VYTDLMKSVKIVVEKHPDCYVAYPLGMEGVVVGEGDTYNEALIDVQSAIKFHIETFGEDTVSGVNLSSHLRVSIFRQGLITH